MISSREDVAVPRSSGTVAAVLWVAIALAACLYVLVLNGAPLYYYDSGAYVENGGKVLKQMGFGTIWSEPVVEGQAAESAAALPVAETTVNGSRSVVYSLYTAMFTMIGGINLVPIMHMVLLGCAAVLPVVVARRVYDPDLSLLAQACCPLIVAGAGAMPFYVAYLMPDILTPILLLLIATVTIWGRFMRWYELAAALALACFCVTSHLSNLPITALLLPVAAFAAVLVHRKTFWMPPLFVALVLGFGLGERMTFKAAAESVQDAEVVYYPFLTARIVADGPGYTFLQDHCPDAATPTCALWDALSKSDDPWRLTASHIIFEKDPDLGSFRLMSEEDQQIVASRQVQFFLKVLLDQPVGTTFAFLKNTLRQAGLYSINMTLPTDGIMENLMALPDVSADAFPEGRFSIDVGWLGAVDTLHTVVYVASLAILIMLLIWPGSVPFGIKGFVLVLLVGILVNAFVCGGVSQPAERYGGRVIWLLPFAATLLIQFSTWANPGMDLTRDKKGLAKVE